MAKGDGTIRQSRGKDGKPIPNCWEVCISTGWNPVKKAYGRSYRTVRGSKAEARKVLQEMNRARDNGIRPDADKVKFGEFAKEYVDRREKSGELASNTVKNMRYALGMANDYLADARITAITPQTIDSLLSAVKEERGISNTTLRRLYVFLHQVMAQAVRYDLLLRNPLDRVDAPKCDPVDRRSLTKQEGERLLDCLVKAERQAYADYYAKEERQEAHGNLQGRAYVHDVAPISCALAARFGLATGARRGEVLALEWGSVLPSGVVVIRKSITEQRELKEPKTRAGIRRVAIDGDMLAALLKWRKHQEAILASIGLKLTANTPVFSSSTGDFIVPSNFSRWWRQFRNENGFESLTFHELRHTQATQLLANGTDVKTVQARLGHSNASLTLNLYAHALPENDRDAADLIGELFGGTRALKGPRKDARTA